MSLNRLNGQRDGVTFNIGASLMAAAPVNVSAVRRCGWVSTSGVPDAKARPGRKPKSAVSPGETGERDGIDALTPRRLQIPPQLLNDQQRTMVARRAKLVPRSVSPSNSGRLAAFARATIWRRPVVRNIDTLAHVAACVDFTAMKSSR
ncbi:MAG: hypothetical protein IPG56_20625 [Caulobacteraceae bacterium]|nr:hypothetical protein [Caulobacteraceae bacterium]